MNMEMIPESMEMNEATELSDQMAEYRQKMMEAMQDGDMRSAEFYNNKISELESAEAKNTEDTAEEAEVGENSLGSSEISFGSKLTDSAENLRKAQKEFDDTRKKLVDNPTDADLIRDHKWAVKKLKEAQRNFDWDKNHPED